MKYIVCKHFKTFNKGTTLNCDNNIITYNGSFVCYATSQNAYDFLARNDDKKGYERYALCEEIKDKIKEIVKEYNKLYLADLEEHKGEENYTPHIVDTVSVAYGKIRANYPTFIKGNEDLFTIAFYNAEPSELEEIVSLIE